MIRNEEGGNGSGRVIGEAAFKEEGLAHRSEELGQKPGERSPHPQAETIPRSRQLGGDIGKESPGRRQIR